MALEAAPGPSASASTGDADELSDAHGDQPVPLDAGMNPVEVPGPRAGKQMALVGRRDEQEALDRLLDGARSGRSGVLVLRGEAGVGKTALLEYLAERASGCELARAAGVQADTELAFAGLQQMFASLLGPLESLPDPQRKALAVAFGLRRGPAPDRFLVGRSPPAGLRGRRCPMA